MISVLAAALALQPDAGFTIERDAFGVPKITAGSAEKAYEGLGYAVAMDRLWQMELSRRMATGRMAEINPALQRTDEATLRTAPLNEDVERQWDRLQPATREAFMAYAQGVNRAIEARKAQGSLPSGYADAGIEPEPWTPTDSVQVSIMLMRRFGTGGAGELRALALLEYFKTQKVKGRELDVLDDLAWQNDPQSIPTLDPRDDKISPRPVIFPQWTRSQTAAQWAALPKPSLLELAGAVAMAADSERQLVAANLGVADQFGSYAVAVSGSRSKTGHALLLHSPQMGHSTPSVVHEAALRAPGLAVNGMNVPGIPMIAIGSTPELAWTLTTGTADLEDIVATKMTGGRLERGELRATVFNRRIKGGGEFTVTQYRTQHGPVVLKSQGAGAVFSLRSALHGHELTGVEAVMRLKDFSRTSGKSPTEASRDAFPCFNIFYALSDGRIGWRFGGRIPLRQAGFDPRLPLPDRAETDWRGFVPFEQMPHVDNPNGGLLANWNNKPAAWWPNGDTPVWGRFFRNRLLLDALPKGKVSVQDLEMAAWTIARRDQSTPDLFRALFSPHAEGALAAQLGAADGLALEGSLPASALRAALIEVRREVFEPWLGGLTSPALFQRAIQPELILAALDGRTRFDYLQGRRREAVIRAALARTPMGEGYVPGMIRYAGQPAIPYLDRGTYIQISEMAPGAWRGRSIAAPGVGEAGEHAFDQAPLARAWQYKPMWRF